MDTRSGASSHPGARERTLRSRRRLHSLCSAYVSSHYRERVTLALAARELGSSQRELQRAYADAGGESFAEQLRRCRLEAAAALLAEQPAIEVRDVARLCGYAGGPALARAFARCYGLAPLRFRQRALAAAAASASARDSTAGSALGMVRRISVPPPGARSAETDAPSWSAT